MPYCTSDDVKLYADIIVTDTSRDELIDNLIVACSSFINEYCNRSFEKGLIVEYFGDVPTSKLFLSNFPIDIKKSIKVWDSWDRTYPDGDLVDAKDYFVDDYNGIIKLDYEIGGGPGSVKVSYTSGELSIPGAIKQACIELVARKLKEGPAGGLGVPSRALPGIGGSITYITDDILPQTKVALDLYRRSV